METLVRSSDLESTKLGTTGVHKYRIMTHSPVMVNVARALYSRQIMTPPSLCHVARVQRWPKVERVFQIRRANPNAQRIVLKPLTARLTLGGSIRKWCRTLVTIKAKIVRTETVKSYNLMLETCKVEW